MSSVRPSVFAIAAFSMLSAGAPAASGATWYVGDAGVDGPSCGLTASTACRSISQAIEFAAPGDTIIVGPGRYSGDLNANGLIGEAGEERGDGACMLSVNKPVIITSSGGAAATMIDGTNVASTPDATVCVTAAGAHFGRPGKGFTVTETVNADTVGIRIDSAGGVTVRGNHVTVFRSDLFKSGVGILAVYNDAPHLIDGNSVTQRGTGIDSLGAATTVSKNQVTANSQGINAGGQIVGNVAMSNDLGIGGWPTATITNNAVWLNFNGIVVAEAFTGAIGKNNLFANISCGLRNIGRIGLSASNNYWGAPSGPGAPPADSVCNEGDGTTIVSPVAKKPFAVKVLKP